MHDDHDIFLLLVEERDQEFVTDRVGVGRNVSGQRMGRVEGWILGTPCGIAGFVQNIQEGLVSGTIQPGARHEEDGGFGDTGHVVSLARKSSCKGDSVIFCPNRGKMIRAMQTHNEGESNNVDVDFLWPTTMRAVHE